MNVQSLVAELREERRRRGWTQTEIARAIGARQRSISAWELGQVTPPAERFVRWAAALGRNIAPEDVTRPRTHAAASLALPGAISAQGLVGCVVDGCDEAIEARGRCPRHYRQWWKATRNSERPPALRLKAKSPEVRFWEKVSRRGPDECWPWIGLRDRRGYGTLYVSSERRKVPTHSYSLELATGERCPDGKEACHHCDNPPCCNPDHIYYGTRQQNVDDMWRRGRARVVMGSAHPHSRLTEANVLAIRERCARGEPIKDLAAEFTIDATVVSRIVNGHRWRHVGGPIRTQHVATS